MTHTEALIKAGFTPMDYADISFIDETITGTPSKEPGTHPHLFKAIAITSEENDLMMLTKDAIFEIALHADILLTDLGCEVHSYTMKNIKPYNSLKIIKLSNL